jgi:hypothetical protein
MENQVGVENVQKPLPMAYPVTNFLLAFNIVPCIILEAKSVPIAYMASKSTYKEVSRVKIVKVVQFRRMIAQIAWRTWRLMPRQHQIWISVDDLIEDGMWKAYQIAAGKWFTESKSSLCTSIYHAVHNHLINEYIVKMANEKRFASLESAGIIGYAEKRRKKQRGNTPADLVSIDAMVSHVLGEDRQPLPLQLSTSEDTIYQNVLSDCFVIPVLGKIYQEASSKLQHQMVVWFLQQPEKIHFESPKFRRAAKEFRMLSRECNLTYYDCKHLIRSPKCLNQLSINLVGVPYDLDHPTPLYNKEL